MVVVVVVAERVRPRARALGFPHVFRHNCVPVVVGGGDLVVL